MNYVIVKFDSDWADEFQVSGFRIMPRAIWVAHEKEAREKFGERSRTVYFGANEFFEYESAEDYLRNFHVVEAAQEDVETVQRIFGRDFGLFPSIEDFGEEDEEVGSPWIARH